MNSNLIRQGNKYTTSIVMGQSASHQQILGEMINLQLKMKKLLVFVVLKCYNPTPLYLVLFGTACGLKVGTWSLSEQILLWMFSKISRKFFAFGSFCD